MSLTTDEKLRALSREVIYPFDRVVGGVRPGFRPERYFASRHIHTDAWRHDADPRSATSAIVNAGDRAVLKYCGILTVPDDDLRGASPRGFAVRFRLAEHVHADIVAHSTDNFPGAHC